MTQTQPRLTVQANSVQGVQQAAGLAVTKADAKIVGAAEGVHQVAQAVRSDAAVIRQTAPAAEPVAQHLEVQATRLQDEIAPALAEAHEELAGKAQPALADLGKVVADLRAADAQVAALAKERDAWKTKFEDSEREREAGLRSVLKWLFIGGLALMAGGIFVALRVNFQSGLALVGAGLALAGASAFVWRFLDWLVIGAAVALAALLVALGVALYQAWKKGQLAAGFSRVAEVFKMAIPAGSLAAVTDAVRTLAGPAQSAAYQALKASGQVAEAPGDET